MGQKTSPIANRLGISKAHHTTSCPAGKKQYKDELQAEMKLRNLLINKFKGQGLEKILMERTANNVHVIMYCSRPGVIIGKKGTDADNLKKLMESKLGTSVHLSVREVKNPDLSANLQAEVVASQLEKRVQFRKAVKRAIQSAMRAGALGIKVTVSGRLSGAEIARSETYKEGRVPLHTFRADIDYALAEAHTTYGVIGVKVWIYRGDVFDSELVS